MKELLKRIWCFITRKHYEAPAPPPAPVPREFTLPAGDVKAFWPLRDAYVNAGEGDREAKYAMWEYLGECFPTVNELGTMWRYESDSINHVKLVERFED